MSRDAPLFESLKYESLITAELPVVPEVPQSPTAHVKTDLKAGTVSDEDRGAFLSVWRMSATGSVGRRRLWTDDDILMAIDSGEF